MGHGLYSEDSIMRRVSRENVLLLAGPRAILMQLAHPLVAQGVDEHSDFRRHPFRRLRRTMRMVMAIVYNEEASALQAARSVNTKHAGVRGSGYHAMDPTLLVWVHATLFDSTLVAYDRFVRPLDPDEREALYQEFKPLGRVLGIPPEGFPKRLADFASYMDGMVESGQVAVGPLAVELAKEVLRPRLRLVPGFAMFPFDVVTAGLLPPLIREQYGLAWGRRERLAFKLAERALPTLVALTPPVLRVWPLPGRSVRIAA